MVKIIINNWGSESKKKKKKKGTSQKNKKKFWKDVTAYCANGWWQPKEDE